MAQKRSGIPIAPSETESAAGRDDAKRPPPSPMRWDCCGCRERFPRKDPGVFDLLGSSLSCDATCLTPPDEYLRLRFAELLPERYRWKERLHPGADRHAVLNNLSDHWVTGGRAVLKVLLGIAIVFSSTPTRR